jgi:asparagine synthase (glutamine-hydrolysing)
MLLSAEARRAVKVVLTGEGADELFAGYGYYRRLVGVRSLFDRTIPRNRDRRGTSGFPYVMTHAKVERLTPDLAPEGEGAPRAEARLENEYLDGSRGLDPLNRALRIDTAGWLPDDLLMKVDRTTMAHGLEARVPFLDRRVVDLAMRMPAGVKWRDGAGKWVLRSAFRDLLPPDVVQRPKHGFNVPLASWFRGPLRTLISEDFPRDAQSSAPWLSTGTTRELVARHVEGRENLARPIWTAYALAVWFRDAARTYRPSRNPSLRTEADASNVIV